MGILNKTFKTAEIGMQCSIIYKNNFILGFLSGIFGLIVQLVFWPVFFNPGAGFNYIEIENTNIAGYYLNEMITYSILVYFIQRGTSMMNISSDIKNDITRGILNIHLIRPIKYLWMKWVFSLSEQIINFVLSMSVLLIISIFLKSVFIFPSDIVQLVIFVLFVLFAYILCYLINCILGMISFWILEINALNAFINMGIALLSGSIFPIDFIKNRIGDFLMYLPFSYLAFIPTQIYLGKISMENIIYNLFVCLFWIVFLALIANALWKYGIRQYSAFGG